MFISPDLTLTAGSPSLRAVRAGWGVVSFTEQQVEEGEGGDGGQEGAKEENWKHRGQEASWNIEFNELGSLYSKHCRELKVEITISKGHVRWISSGSLVEKNSVPDI